MNNKVLKVIILAVSITIWSTIGVTGAGHYSMTIPCDASSRVKKADFRIFWGALAGPIAGVPWHIRAGMRKRAGYSMYVCDET